VVLERDDGGKNNPNTNAIQKGTWEYHQKQYGADFPYQNFAPQFARSYSIPITGPMFSHDPALST
jgi:hypothetical protein